MRPTALLALALIALAACGDGSEAARPAPATAAELAERMAERFRQNVGAVDGFSARAEGAEVSYAVARDSASLDWLRQEVSADQGSTPNPAYVVMLSEQVPNALRLSRGLATATFGGLVTRDGRQAYELVTDDAGALVGEPGMMEANPHETAEYRVYVDPETYDVLEIFQNIAIDTLAAPITRRIIYSDFRTVDGLTLPFAIRSVETGINQVITEQERMVAGGRIGLQRQQAEQAPPSPERDALLADLAAQQRFLGEGVADERLTVDEVTVRRAP